MITEDYVSFETAKLLKEKGFDWDCDTREYYPQNPVDECDPNGVYAPTLQMAMKWLREKHFIIAVVPLWFYADGECRGWAFNLWADDNLEVDAEIHSYLLSTYEEACEVAIKYCLKNLI